MMLIRSTDELLRADRQARDTFIGIEERAIAAIERAKASVAEEGSGARVSRR